MKTSKALHITASVARTLLGVVFIFSGFVKAIDPLGTTYKIEDYLHAFGSFFTLFMPLAELMAWGLILVELVLGICLLLNVRTKWTSWIALAVMLVMTPITLYLALTNPISDCGCFGDAIKLSNWATFYKNIVLLVLVITLLLTKKHVPQTFTPLAELCIYCLACVLTLCIMTYSRLHLPPIDFRPYKIGNNIPELMIFPDDAEQDEYEVRFIYEKDGVQQTFTLQNYPKGDSTYTFVDQQTVLIKKGYEPPIHDFVLSTLDGDDITDDLLEAPRATLIVVYDTQKANMRQAEKMVRLLQNMQELGEPCFIITGSTDSDIMDFINDVNYKVQSTNFTLGEEHILVGDPVMMKTIVRATPGVMVMEYGTITDKYNLRNRKIK